LHTEPYRDLEATVTINEITFVSVIAKEEDGEYDQNGQDLDQSHHASGTVIRLRLQQSCLINPNGNDFLNFVNITIHIFNMRDLSIIFLWRILPLSQLCFNILSISEVVLAYSDVLKL
jgi:hypothetical protein